MDEQSANGWDWNELRIILSVAQAGSLSAAARALGTSHPTVFRKIRQVEKRLGAALFEKSATGYVPTTLGEAVIASAEQISSEINSLGVKLGVTKRVPSGVLRMTCSDTVYTYVLTPMLAKYRMEFPEVSLEVTVTNEFVDLQRQDVDVAFRSSRRTVQNLHGVKLGDLILGVHAHRDHPAVTQDPPRLGEYDWVGFDESMTLTTLSNFMREFDLERKVVFRINSLIGACDAVRQNIGLAMLPYYVGRPPSDIVPIFAEDTTIHSELWMVSSRARQRMPLVRGFFEFFESEAERLRGLLQGGWTQPPDV